MKQINLIVTEKENRWPGQIVVGNIVKIGIPGGDGYQDEWLWVKVVARSDGDTFVGQFNDIPLNTEYRFGDQFPFKHENVLDVWRQTPWGKLDILPTH